MSKQNVGGVMKGIEGNRVEVAIDVLWENVKEILICGIIPPLQDQGVILLV